MNDNVKTVFLESANSLKRLTDNIDIQSEIEEKLIYWKEKEERVIEKFSKNKHMDIPKWKKTDWVAILKEQLKKPMRR